MEGRRCTALALALTLAAAIIAGCSGSPDHAEAIERHKKLASELRDNRLYEAAAEEYRRILAYDDLDDPTRAGINYLIGRLYFENVQDYEQAAAYYVRAKALDPNGDFVLEASKNLVTALERSGNLVNAKRQLDQLTDIGADSTGENDVAVARIGGIPVWRSQVDDAIEMLPPEVQKQYTRDRAARVDFAHQYVASELFYHAAIREGFDSDPEIKQRTRELNRQLLVERYVREKVLPQIQIDTSDVRNFYLANKDSRYSGAPYDSVQARVLIDYQSQKAESAFQDYITMLAQRERVEFLDKNVK